MNTALLKQRISEKGWDTETLADRCLSAPAYIEQVLKGLRPSKRLISLMARELDLDPHEIAPDDFPKPSKPTRTAAAG